MMQQKAALVRAFLVLPPGKLPTRAEECLAAFCERADAASLLLPLPDEGTDALTGLARRAQDLGLAVLLADDVAAMRVLQADGVHLTRAEAHTLARLRRELGEDVIIGACCPAQRHAAMELGEAGVDYLGIDQRIEARGENLLAWWAQMFTVPVVAMHPAAPQDLPVLARLGADFAVPPPQIWEDPAQAARLAAAWAENLHKIQQGHGTAQKNG